MDTTDETEPIHDLLDQALDQALDQERDSEGNQITRHNQTTSYIGNTTVVINKRFRPPISSYDDKIIRKYYKHPGLFKCRILNNYDFYLRFYLPRREVIKKYSSSKSKLHMIIMFNGLDESLDIHYKLYDRLGASFAYSGIASVLLPTPFHLGRALTYKKLTVNEKPKVMEPSKSLLENHWFLPVNFVQAIYEFNYLVKLIQCNFDKITNDPFFVDVALKSISDDDKHFYELFFGDRDTEISVLGYSLGGLKALACFKYKPDFLKTCVLLNSGGSLRNLKLGPPVMENTKWQDKVVEPLHKERGGRPIKDEHQYFSSWRHSQIVSSVLFEEKQILDDPECDHNVGKLIIVAGGKDKLVEPESIKRLESKAHGLNILQVADLGHFIGDDPQFNRWYSRITNMLIDFFDDQEGEPLSSDATIFLYALLNFCCKDDLSKKLKEKHNIQEAYDIICKHTNKELEKDFSSILRASYAYFKSVEKFIEKVERSKRKSGLFFGQIALRFIESKDKDAVYIDGLILSEKDKKSGKVLLEKGEITENQIDSICKTQLDMYRKILELTDVIDAQWKGKFRVLLSKAQSGVNYGSNSKQKFQANNK